jgi:hypothetical protein
MEYSIFNDKNAKIKAQTSSTGLAKVAIQFSASLFVLKSTPIAISKNVK